MRCAVAASGLSEGADAERRAHLQIKMCYHYNNYYYYT